MAVTVGLLIWIFFSANDYMMAGFNCADQVSEVEACASPVEKRALINIVVAIATWLLLAWLLFRKRAKV